MSIDKISIENYRVFSEETKINFKNISLLTGPNSSGKSSVFKLLLLLQENFKFDSHLTRSFEHLYIKGESRILDGFSNIINNKNGSKIISISLPFNFDQTIKLKYEIDEQDEKLGNLIDLELSTFNYESDIEETYLIVKLATEGFGFGIDFPILKKIITDQIIVRNKNDEVSKKFHGGKTRNERENPLNKIYDPSKPIYDLEEYCAKLQITPENAELRLFEYMSNFQEGYNPEEDFDHRPVFANIIDYIKKLYLNRNIRSRNSYGKKIADEIKLVNPTDNGYAFFNEVAEYLNKSFSEFFASMQRFKYINSERTLENRVILLNENKVLNKALLNYLTKPDNFNIKFINKWLKTFNIVDETEEFIINHLSYSACEVIFGNTKLINEGKKGRNLIDLGFGITQIFTLIFCLAEKGFSRTFLIEEPETNLHPNFQSLLADLIVDAQKENHNQFIIETHSEYLIRKFQYLVASKSNRANKRLINILYFTNHESQLKIDEIGITDDGLLTKDFGPGFIDESTRIIFNIWNLPGQN